MYEFLLQFCPTPKKMKLEKSPSKESFEKVPFITAALTYLGFYILMFLGFINQLFFIPKVATEKNRQVQ